MPGTSSGTGTGTGMGVMSQLPAPACQARGHESSPGTGMPGVISRHRYARKGTLRAPIYRRSMVSCKRGTHFLEKYGFVQEGHTFLEKVWFRAREIIENSIKTKESCIFQNIDVNSDLTSMLTTILTSILTSKLTSISTL